MVATRTLVLIVLGALLLGAGGGAASGALIAFASQPAPADAGPTGGGVPQGEPGPVGPPGVPGPSGPAGETGPAGATGAAGASGPTGSPGARGPAGPQGPQGAQGVAGVAGGQGPQGVPGVAGQTGPQGEPGAVSPFPYAYFQTGGYGSSDPFPTPTPIFLTDRLAGTLDVNVDRDVNDSVTLPAGTYRISARIAVYSIGDDPMVGSFRIGLSRPSLYRAEDFSLVVIEPGEVPPAVQTRSLQTWAIVVIDEPTAVQVQVTGDGGTAPRSLVFASGSLMIEKLD